VLEILELLKNDKSLYVQKSVANNLNDISKDKHHGSNNPSFGETEIDIDKMTDTELNSMIERTFNLIDNEL
jgi:3-methyladenine DNA glycosylase AlkC